VAVLASVAVLMSGCAVTRTESGQPTTAPPSGLEKFYGQTVQWGDCAGFGGPDDRLPPSAECARVTVPVDYAAGGFAGDEPGRAGGVRPRPVVAG
jgi:hypothetical protein